MMEHSHSQHADLSLLLRLPSTCLEHILKDCTIRTLFKAAQAHSILHQAAAVVLQSRTSITCVGAVVLQSRTSITCCSLTTKQQLKSLQWYLSSFGSHIESLSLDSPLCRPEQLHPTELPAGLANLASLQLYRLMVLLSKSFSTGLGSRLTQLCLDRCTIRGTQLADSLRSLPNLQHLSLKYTYKPRAHGGFVSVTFPGELLPALQHLTYLELTGGILQRSSAVQHLHRLTDLRDLCLHSAEYQEFLPVTARSLSSLQLLTSLELKWVFWSPAQPDFDSSILTGMPLGSEWGRECHCLSPRACM
jgi:hypothetical protein